MPSGVDESRKLYEPTLFALIEAQVPGSEDSSGIREAVARAGAALDAGDRDAAAGHFIDYWMGAGSWARWPDPRRPAVAASVANVRRWAHALMTEAPRWALSLRSTCRCC